MTETKKAIYSEISSKKKTDFSLMKRGTKKNIHGLSSWKRKYVSYSAKTG